MQLPKCSGRIPHISRKTPIIPQLKRFVQKLDGAADSQVGGNVPAVAQCCGIGPEVEVLALARRRIVNIGARE